jgi:SnoaL-like domain
LSEPVDARAAIADLVHTYALYIRAGNGAECAKLFTPEAVFEVREAPLGGRGAARSRSRVTGHDSISSYLARASGSETQVCPLIHNLLIRVAGREATSSCIMTSFVWPSGQQFIGEYEDSYKHETTWLFTSRVFTMLGQFSYAAAQQS